MNGKESTTWQEAAALERFQMISPLLDEELDRDKKIQLRKEKAKQYDVSCRRPAELTQNGRTCLSQN